MHEPVFFEAHSDIPRQGPGSAASTRRAFSLMNNLPKRPIILDIGCGTGMQTLELAHLSRGRVVALDNHQPFLDELRRRAERAGLAGRVETVNGSMFSLDFGNYRFDTGSPNYALHNLGYLVIWSEGAIYLIGFERGLR
jgi:ubiquinone/menaquinone biosynthesis C-methylase UbiE